ncbi:hypothetical protein IAT38_003845 [Cryptococcus sp. DSM 104549]
MTVFEIPGYTLLKDLGEGGSGFVKLARHERRDEVVAIKFVPILDECVGKAEERAKVITQNLATEREMEVVKMIEHRNIVRWHETRIHDGYISIVMDYASGGDLFDYVTLHNRLTEPQAQPIFAQLLCAVSYLHSLGIAHRDLKLENVFLGPNGGVLLGDFGMAGPFNTCRPVMGSPCGTHGYAAPEMAAAGSVYDPIKVDTWGLGCMLFVMLTGNMPYQYQPGAPPDNCSFEDLSWFALTTELEYPFHMGHEVVGLLKTLLDICPETRVSPKAARNDIWLKGHRGLMFEDGEEKETPEIAQGDANADGYVGVSNRVADYETPRKQPSSDGHSSDSDTSATSRRSTHILTTPYQTPCPTPHRTPRLALSELPALFPTEEDEEEEDGVERARDKAGAGDYAAELPEATLDMLRRLSHNAAPRKLSKEGGTGDGMGLGLNIPESQIGKRLGHVLDEREDPQSSDDSHISFADSFVESIYTDEETYYSICRFKSAHPVSGDTSITDHDKRRESIRPLLLARSRSTFVDGSKRQVLDKFGMGHLVCDFARL